MTCHRSTGVQPSAEAIAAACSESVQGPRGQEATIRGRVTAGLYAAYKIDSPRIHAEGVAEGRAAMLREVVEFVRDRQSVWIVGRFERNATADAIEARFLSEGTG